MKKEPRPHQQAAMEAVVESFKKDDRCHIVMACGTGKTFTALYITANLQPKTVVVFVPSLALINQFMKEWLPDIDFEYSMLSICSDSNVIGDEDESSLLYEAVDFPVTSDPGEIRKFLKHRTDNVKVIFCTYHSSSLLGVASAGETLIDLAIFDEAHKTAGYNKTMFSYALLDSNVNIKKRLFMTATPRHGIPRMKKAGEYQEVFSMDDETLYGKRVYTVTFRDAIKLGLICDYKIIISAIAKNNAGHVFNKDFEYQEKTISLQKAIKESGAKKVITFHSSINHALYFAEFLKINKISPNIMHVNSKLGMERRHDLMHIFKKADRAIITNSKCLTEGVDVPSVDMVAFLNPKSSKIDIVQAIGRALRKSPGKELGYIFLPLLVNNVNDLEAEITGSEFKAVWEVLNAMMEQDSELSDTVNKLTKVGGQQTGEKVEYDPFLKFLTINNADLKKLIEVKVLTRLTSNWDKMYAELCDYKTKHNSVNILKSHPYPELNNWMKSQRNNKKRLAPYRVKLLDDIGFDWRKKDSPIPWGISFDMLKAYKDTHGRFPINRLEDPKLYAFLERQRSDFKAGKLTTHRYNALKDLGIKFYTKILHKDGPEHELNNILWGDKYKELCAYQKLHGTTHVPQRGEHAALGKWVCAQRDDWRKKKLHKYRYEMLSNINFEFDPTESLWQQRFSEFNNCKAAEETMPPVLRAWCDYQRKALRLNILPADKLKLLEEANFRFDALKLFSYSRSCITEHKRYNELITHYNKHKTWAVPKSNIALSSFTKHIRGAYRENKLSKSSISVLNKLGFAWNAESQVGRKTA